MFVASVRVNNCDTRLDLGRCSTAMQGYNVQKSVSFKADPILPTVSGVLASLFITSQNNVELQKNHVPETVQLCDKAMQNMDNLSRQCRAACGKLYMELSRGVNISVENATDASGKVRQVCTVVKKIK